MPAESTGDPTGDPTDAPAANGSPPDAPPPDAPPAGPAGTRGADLARQTLARAKQDARAKAAGRARSSRAAGRDNQRDEKAPAPGVRPRPRLPGIAAPGRDWAEPVRLRGAVDRLLSERGWKATATDATVLARWDALVGPDVAAHCRPVALRDGELVVEAESTAWATQLRTFLAAKLLATLRAELGAGVVTKLVVRGPTTPNWGHGRLRAPGGRGPRDTYG